MNEIKIVSLYNEKTKKAFCDSSGYSEQSIYNNYMRIFKVSSDTEYFLNKDLFDFNREELKRFFYQLKPRTAGGSMQNVNRVSTYLDWAINRGLTRNQNALIAVDREWKEQFANTDAKFLWTDAEIEEIIKKVKNVHDKTIIKMLFEGIRGEENQEIINLTHHDVDRENGILVLKDKNGTIRKKKVTPELIDLCVKSQLELQYDKSNGDPGIRTKAPVLNLIDSDHIIKSANTNVKGNSPRQNIVFRRLTVVSQKELGGEPNFNPTQILLSGLLAQAKNVFLKKGSFNYDDAVELLKGNDMKPTSMSMGVLNEDTIKRVYGIK